MYRNHRGSLLIFLVLFLGEKSRNMIWTPGTDQKIKKEKPTKGATVTGEKLSKDSAAAFVTSNTAITTNNYYINNNYYASDDILKGIFPKGEKKGKGKGKGTNFGDIKEHQTKFPSQEAQQKILSDILKNVTKLNESRGSLKVTRIMNFVIIIVALLLVLITLFLH